MNYDKFSENKHIIIGEIHSEKPVKKDTNCGTIFLLLKFQFNYGIEWKKFSSNHKIPCYLEKFVGEILGVKKIDLRDFCLKRGNIVKNLKIKIFLEKKMVFKAKNSIFKYSLPFLKKEVEVQDFIKYQQEYSQIFEKSILKGIQKTKFLSKEIEKLNYKKFGKIKCSKEFILKISPQHCIGNKNLLFFKDLGDIKIENFNSIFLLLKWIDKKKENFLKNY